MLSNIVTEKILNSVYDLLYDFLIQIICLLYEFVHVFDEVNSSDCYGAATNKPKFGPYIRPQISLEKITL